MTQDGHCETCGHWTELDYGDGRCALMTRRVHYTYMCYRWWRRVVVDAPPEQMALDDAWLVTETTADEEGA